MITLQVTEWQMMVLRAALTRHVTAASSQKQRKTANDMLIQFRDSDNPQAIVDRILCRQFPER